MVKNWPNVDQKLVENQYKVGGKYLLTTKEATKFQFWEHEVFLERKKEFEDFTSQVGQWLVEI
jgi:hypothetical protein